MVKQKKTYTAFQNVVVFPGTVERLVSEAMKSIKLNQFEKAVQNLEEALRYTDGDEHLLGVYAYSLYETKSYHKAKKVCERLLDMGPTMYFEVMELYLSICLQLKEFQQVEKMISSLFEEGVIPPDKLEQFQRLKELNAGLSGKIEEQEEASMAINVKPFEPELYELNTFLSLTASQQVNKLHELTLVNIRPILHHLKAILENKQTHPFVKSLILILMNEQKVDTEIIVEKFQRRLMVNPAKIGLPTELAQYKMISNIINDKLQQEPSVLEMVEYLIAKHSIVAYPFEWLDFEPHEVAQGYIGFVHQMFGQQNKVNQEIYQFIQELEKLSELQ